MESTAADQLFEGRSRMAALMRAHDWSQSPLGPPDTWPRALRTVVRIVLTSRFAMWMGWGEDLTFFYNDAYTGTLGTKHPWALGRPSRDVWAEIWSDIGPRIEGVLAHEEATWDEDLLLFLERSGYPEETYHTFSYSPVSDDDGVVRGHLCVVTEETERVIAERRMALLRDVATDIAGASTEAQLFTELRAALSKDQRDLPFSLVYLFEAGRDEPRLAMSTLGGELAGAGAAIPREDPLTRWRLEAARSGEIQLVDLDDGRAWPRGPWSQPPIQALVVPLAQRAHGEPVGVFIAALNPFRRLDETYRSFIGLLAGQIAGALANVRAYAEERRRAEALAELDRAKTTFFSNVSHEFRTPLTLMLGPLEDLSRREETAAPEIREKIDVAHRNGLRLLRLVNTLLDFSRIEAGRVQPQLSPVDLPALTIDLASTFRSAMDKAGLAYRVICPPLPARVMVDRDMWEKVVLNLISNAFKFTLRGEVTITLQPAGSSVELIVADTGVGIPEGELPYVFDRFHRVAETRGRSHEGTGIGLALVNELVRLHEGEVTVTSELGVGTRLVVRLPMRLAQGDADSAADVAGAPPQRAAAYVEEALRWLPSAADDADRQPETDDELEPAPAAGGVLLVDDNADMRDYARRLLAERWEVRTAANGREALGVARQWRPDVIVTDVMMPELDGFGLLRELRRDHELRQTAVIMLSARAGEEARQEAMSATADDYLVKPFAARDLLTRVNVQVTRARERRLEARHLQQLDRIFRQAPVAIAVLRGPDHVYELANPFYLELVGNRSIVGRSLRDALPEIEAQGVGDLLTQVRTTGEPFIGRSLRFTLDPGPHGAREDVFFDFVYQPLTDDHGRVEAIVIVAHDVSSLVVARQQAERASQAKDEFLATLSHELRTPLNAVLGYTQMLRAGVVAPDRHPTVLETIERNAKVQQQLVSDVLDVSRVITGKLRLDIRPVDLVQVIEQAMEAVIPAASAKGVRLQSALDQPGMPVAGDPQRLQQVVWNLLSNAVKFTPRGGRVQVRLTQVNSQVEISVSDTGEGIAPEFVPMLFQRFAQADGALSRAHGGLGLGLALCRHIVEAHGGRINAVSPGKGQGTTVRVELPLMLIDELPIDTGTRVHPSDDDVAAAPFTLADLSGLTVLLVDDDPDALRLARDVLVAAGAEAIAVSDPHEALDRLREHDFDVAVIDIGMNGMDGYELLRHIREQTDEDRRRLPVAALTAYARVADRTRSLQAGFQMHLTKPVQPPELAAAVSALAGARRAV